jgi:hypothetical protein
MTIRQAPSKPWVLTVTWELAERPGTGLSNPRALALVPRFEGEVNFVRADKK